MRNWTILLGLALLLSGCTSSGDSDPEPQGPVSDGSSDVSEEPEAAQPSETLFEPEPEPEGPPGPGEGKVHEYSCKVDLGSSFLGGTFSVPPIELNTGSCALVSTDQVSVAVETSAPAGCSVSASVDKDYPKDTTFLGSCDDGVMDATMTLKLRMWT